MNNISGIIIHNLLVSIKQYIKMKSVFIVALLIAVAIAAPLDDSKNAQILRYDNDNIGVDGYKFA